MSSCLNKFSLAGMVAPAAVFALFAVSPAPTFAALVANSKHNLSASGTGTIKATTETEICVFCHAPHNASPAAPLWNRTLVSTTYTPYTSSTLKSAPGQPNGSSLLCLGCHDGTIALGKVRNRASNITLAGGVTTMPAGNSNLGTNLSDDHPISFVYNAALRTANGELADPAPLTLLTSAVRLDASSQMQCTSCHNAHDNANPKFLVVNNIASALCVTCHTKTYWTASDHKTSAATWNLAGTNPWLHTSQTTVAANACENCHQPHTAGGSKRILNYLVEEANCYTCHTGNVAGKTAPVKNIQTESTKIYGHKVANYLGIHDPTEAATVTTSHVECVDCHNPHAANSTAGSIPGGSATPTLHGSQIGVRGISDADTAVNPVTAEYEICYRCHAGGGAANIPASAFPRKIVQNNKRLEFKVENASHHAVAGPRTATGTVPSLISPWTASSRLRCTDCHNNNAGPYSSGTPTAPTGTGTNGPHGSTNPFLLERAYLTTDNSSGVNYAEANYALCFKCHSATNIFSTSSFSKHSRHLSSMGNARTVCSTCHDPHGINGAGSAANGNTSNKRLINFRTDIVTASSSGALYWESTGTNTGRCYLTCHGRNHNPYSY